MLSVEKGKKVAYMAKILSNEKGNTLVLLLVAGAIAGGIATLTVLDRKGMDITKEGIKREESLAALDKLKALAMFAVSSNLIICKSDAFEAEKKKFEGSGKMNLYKNRCKWSGFQYVNGKSEAISKERIGFSNMRYIGFENGDADMSKKKHPDFGALAFDVDTLKDKNSEQENSAKNTARLKGTVSFKLYDFSKKDPLNIADNLGRLNLRNAAADQDMTAVLIKVETVYDNGKGRAGKESVKKKVASYMAVRRPIAIPKITINPAECKMGCSSSIGQNDNPECRSEQSFDNVGAVELTGSLTNLGPGVIYELRLAKDIVYDPRFHPNKKSPPTTSVDALGEKDYLLPGETVAWTDSMECESVKTNVTVTTSCSRSRDRNCSASTTSEEKPISKHSEPAGKVTYSLDFGNAVDFTKEPKEYVKKLAAQSNEELRLEDGTALDRDILSSKMRELNNAEFLAFAQSIRLPAGTKTMSSNPIGWIEPARMAMKVEESDAIPQTEKTNVVIRVIPTH